MSYPCCLSLNLQRQRRYDMLSGGVRSMSGGRSRQSPSVSTVELNIHNKARQAKTSGVINKRTGFTPSDTSKVRKGKTSASTDDYSRPSTDVSLN